MGSGGIGIGDLREWTAELYYAKYNQRGVLVRDSALCLCQPQWSKSFSWMGIGDEPVDVVNPYLHLG